MRVTTRRAASSLLILATLSAFTGTAAPAAAPPPTGGVSVTVSASYWGFTRSREVTLRVDRQGLDAAVDVQLDRPFEAAIGVRELAFRVHVLNGEGLEVHAADVRLAELMTGVQFFIRLPKPDVYSLVVARSEIHAGPARIRLSTGEEVRLPIDARPTLTAQETVPPQMSPTRDQP